MQNDEWKGRLAQAIKNSGKSDRAISLASGNGAGYVHSILKEGKDPTIEKLIAVCDAVPVSLVAVLYGADMLPEDMDILKALQDSPEKRQAILALIRPHVTI